MLFELVIFFWYVVDVCVEMVFRIFFCVCFCWSLILYSNEFCLLGNLVGFLRKILIIVEFFLYIVNINNNNWEKGRIF